MPVEDTASQVVSLQIRLLGKPELRGTQTSLVSLSVKGQALFFYLVASGRPCGRATLAGLLWPELPERNARTNLRVELTKLRRQLGDYLATTHTEIAFAQDSDHWIDLKQFELAAAERDPARMKDAIALYRGDFLTGFMVSDAPEFETWVISEQARYRQLYIEMLFAVSEEHAARQAWERALDCVQRILALEPWREAAHRATMYFLAQMGRRNTALMHFQHCRQILAEELGVGPSPETETLYRQIRTGRIALQTPHQDGNQPATTTAVLAAHEAPAHLFNVPVIPIRFIGRTAETQRVLDLLCSEECHLVTLVGLGGVGKSHLAVHLAQALGQALDQQVLHESIPPEPPTRFPDGIVFVQLESLRALDLLPDAIGQALGIVFQGENNPRFQLFSYLQSRRLLLILDNFEHLTGGAGFVQDLLACAPGVTILVTSRQPLHINGEWRVPLHGLPIPQQHEDSEEIARFAAVQLFLQVARRLDLGFTVSGPAHQARRRAIGNICRLVEGMPLALEMAATWTTTLSCAQIAHQIAHDLTFLSFAEHDPSSRHHSLRAVFGHTVDMLPQRSRLIFARLSAFRGGWMLDAAGEIAGASPVELAHLLDCSLVRRNADGRYGMHPQLHRFAAEILMGMASEVSNGNEDEGHDVVQAHADYYRSYLHEESARIHASAHFDATHTGNVPNAEGDEHVDDEHVDEGIDRIVAELDNIRGAWEWSIAHTSLDTIIEFAEDLWVFYKVKGQFTEAAAMIETICRRQDLTSIQRATWYRLLGETYIRLGQYRTALKVTAQALELFNERLPQGRFGFARGIAHRVVLEIGRWIVPGWRNRMPISIYPGQAGQKKDGDIDIRRLELARAYNQLCRVALFLQDSWLGIYCNARALDHGLVLGPSSELAMACVSWSMLCSHFLSQPAAYYGDLADQFAAPDSVMTAEVAIRRAIVDLAESNWGRLEARSSRACALAYRQRDWQNWGDANLILAVAYYYQARFDESMVLLRELEQRMRDHSNLTLQILAVQVQAAVYLAQQQIDSVEACLDRMQALLPYLTDNLLINVIALALRTLVYVSQDDVGQAEYLAEQLARRLQGNFIPTPFHLVCFACVAEVHLRLLALIPEGERTILAHRRHAQEACRRLRMLARLFPLAKPYAALYEGEFRWHMGEHSQARRLWEKGRQHAQRLETSHVQDQLEAAMARSF